MVLQFHFGRAFENQNRQIQFWATLETEIVDLYGVYSQAFSIHFALEKKVPDGENVFWGGTAGLLWKYWFWNEVQGIFRRTGFGIERPKNCCRYGTSIASSIRYRYKRVTNAECAYAYSLMGRNKEPVRISERGKKERKGNESPSSRTHRKYVVGKLLVDEAGDALGLQGFRGKE